MEATVANSNLSVPETFSNEVVGGPPLCGLPRKISRNAFITGFVIRDRTSNATKCSTSLVEKFTAAMEANVNSEDKCKGVNNTRVKVTATCTLDGQTAKLTAAVDIFSFYPCSYVPWYRAITKNKDTVTPCGPVDPDPSCTCQGIAGPVCDAIRAAYNGNVTILNDGEPLYVRFNNCGACLDRSDVFCSPDNYRPSCPESGCTGLF